MGKKKLITGIKAKKDALKALEIIESAVSSTLGPSGCPVIIDRFEEATNRVQPTTTKDGVTVIRHLSFDDPILHAIHQFCFQSATYSVKESGDGTTSTIVLALELAKRINKYNSKRPQLFARRIKNDIDKCIDIVDNYKYTDKKSAYLAALTSSNNDEEIADIAMKVVEQCGAYSSVVIEKDPLALEKFKIDKQDGFEAGRGYDLCRELAMSINHDRVTTSAPIELPNSKILTFNGSFYKKEQLEPIIESIMKEYPHGGNFTIFCYSASDEITTSLVKFNKTTKYTILIQEIVLTAEPGAALRRLGDIAAFAGSQLFDGSWYINRREVSDKNIEIDKKNKQVKEGKSLQALEELPLLGSEYFGDVGQVYCKIENCLILGKGKKNYIKKRCEDNDFAAKHVKSDYSADIVKTRNAELAHGLTTVIVGGGQWATIQERADRLDDAIQAAQSALSHGVVAGAGTTYIRIAEELKDVITPETREALSAVTKKIVSNFGDNLSRGNKKKIINNDDYVISFNDKDEIIFGDFRDLKVADSVKTIKSTLKNACELAILVTTTNCMSLDDSLGERSSLELLSKTMKE